jgi:hypothetical protein
MPASCERALKAMYCSAKTLARRAVLGIAGDGDDVQDVGGGRGFDLDLAQQFTRAGLRAKLLAGALRHFGGVGDEHLRVRFALRFAAAGGKDLQGGVGQRGALKGDAGSG